MTTPVLYYSKIAPAASASSVATGYMGSNVLNEDILRPWRSLTTGAEWLNLNFSSSTVKALLIEEVNFSSADISVYYGGGWHALPTATTIADKSTGRRRALVDLSAQPAMTDISIYPVGVTDGKTYFSIGAAYLFASSSVQPLEPWLNASIRALYPKAVNTSIPNGRVAQATTGPPFLSISVPFRRSSTQDGFEIARRAQFATCGLDLNVGSMPRLSLPVRMIDDYLTEDYADEGLNNFTIELTEQIIA